MTKDCFIVGYMYVYIVDINMKISLAENRLCMFEQNPSMELFQSPKSNYTS